MTQETSCIALLLRVCSWTIIFSVFFHLQKQMQVLPVITVSPYLNKQQHHLQYDINNFTKITYWKHQFNVHNVFNRKVKQLWQIKKQRVFVNDILLVFDFEKQLECEILTQSCLSKHQHCLQCEINKKLFQSSWFNVENVPKVKESRQMNKQTWKICPWNKC